MKLIGILGLLTLITLNINNVSAWDQDELEIFDLVEEINENFYTILKIDQVNHLKLAFILFFFSNKIIICVYRKRRQQKFVKHSVNYLL